VQVLHIQISADHAYFFIDNSYDKNLEIVSTALACLLYFVCHSFIPSLLGTRSQNWVLDRRWHDSVA
jgi:hypothetical protein